MKNLRDKAIAQLLMRHRQEQPTEPQSSRKSSTQAAIREHDQANRNATLEKDLSDAECESAHGTAVMKQKLTKVLITAWPVLVAALLLPIPRRARGRNG